VSRSNPYRQRNDGGWCECSECGRRFGGLSGFDRHKITTTGQEGYDPEYDWRCATDAELADRGLTLDGRGWWVRQDGYSDLREGTQTPAEPEVARWMAEDQPRLFDPERYSPVRVSLYLRLPESNARSFAIASALGNFLDSDGTTNALRNGRSAIGSRISPTRLPAVLGVLNIHERRWQRVPLSVTDAAHQLSRSLQGLEEGLGPRSSIQDQEEDAPTLRTDDAEAVCACGHSRAMHFASGTCRRPACTCSSVREV
jgi:hypothetical protein